MILYETAAGAAEPAAGACRRARTAHRGENRQSLTPNAHTGHRMLREPMFPEIFLEVCAMACSCNGFSGLTFPDFVQQRCCNPCCQQSSGSVGGTSTTNPTCTCTCTCTQGSGSVGGTSTGSGNSGSSSGSGSSCGCGGCGSVGGTSSGCGCCRRCGCGSCSNVGGTSNSNQNSGCGCSRCSG